MATLREFTQTKARPLPVIVLADVSGSMKGEKIAALNQALREMISSFGEEDELRAEIHICVITFGGEAREHIGLKPAKDVTWEEVQATGNTPMGRAMELAAELIADKSKIPSRAYTPTIVLASDGAPNDDWQAGLKRLTQDVRAQKADRIALAIGSDADESMLQAFLGDPAKKVFHAEDARKIRSFFKFVTMSVGTRTRSANPDEVPAMGDPFSLGSF